MKSRVLVLCLLAAMTAFAVVASAADPEPAAPVQAGRAGENDPTVKDLDSGKAGQAEGLDAGAFQDPLMVQIEALMNEADVELAKLQAQFDQATDNYEAMAVNRQISEIKTNLELDILKLQADRARQTGRLDVAEEIDTAIEEMTTPRPTKQPIDRPAPGVGNQ